MEVIRELGEYRKFATSRFRWRPSSVEFDFPLGEGSVCGSCQKEFTSTEYLFLMCVKCLGQKVRTGTSPQRFEAVVYGLYSEESQLLYVGVTKNPINRVHSHMLDKNFHSMRVIRYFDSRQEADDFEKYSIHRLRPPMNRLFERDWTSVPKRWSKKEFGKVGSRPRKKPAKTRTQEPLSLCHKCSSPVGRKNMTTERGNTFHKKCSPSGAIMINVSERGRKEIQEHNERILRANKIRKKSTSGSSIAPMPTVNCAYCKKPVSQGRHIPCRRRRLEELGRL